MAQRERMGSVVPLPLRIAPPRQSATRAFPVAVLGALGSGLGLATDMLRALGWSSDAGAVAQLHDHLFATMGWSWKHPPTAELVRATIDSVTPHLTNLMNDLTVRAAGRPLVLTDPRLGLVLPWWRGALPHDTHFALVVRNPLDVARGLQHRAQLSFRHGLAWWEHHWSTALADLHGHPVHVLHFMPSALHADAALPFARGLTAPDDDQALLAALQHVGTTPHPHRPASDDAVDDFLTARQRDLWTFLSILPPAAEPLDVPSPLREPARGALVTLFEPSLAPSAAPPVAPETSLDTAAMARVSAERDQLAARLEAATAETQTLRHRLQVATYESVNLRMTLERIERTRQQTAEHLSIARARIEAVETRLATALAGRDQAVQALAAGQPAARRAVRHALDRLWRRLRPGRRPA